MGSKRKVLSLAYSTAGVVVPVVVIGAVMALLAGCEPDPLSPVTEIEFAQTGGGDEGNVIVRRRAPGDLPVERSEAGGSRVRAASR